MDGLKSCVDFFNFTKKYILPLHLHQMLQPDGELGVWKLTELESYFLKHLDFKVGELEEIQQLKKGRKLEWLAVRWLVHQLSGRTIRGAIKKDEFGKPYLENSPFQISMSHSGKMAAVIAATNPVGVDIQEVVPKITKIAHKFMRPEESNSLQKATELEHLHVYWGAKEALYKAYGRKLLDFKQHIHITPFDYDVTIGQCEGYVIKDDFKAFYQLTYQKVENYILVYGQEVS